MSNIEIYIGLKPLERWTSANSRAELQRLMEQKLSVFPGLLLTFSQPIATRVDELLSGVKAQLAIKLFGPDLDVLAEKGEQLSKLVAQVPVPWMCLLSRSPARRNWWYDRKTRCWDVTASASMR